MEIFILQGFVEWRETTLPGQLPNIKYFYSTYLSSLDPVEDWEFELVEYLDCFYRNMYKYEYIGVFDIDELIVPTNGDNWTQMIHNIRVCFLSMFN